MLHQVTKNSSNLRFKVNEKIAFYHSQENEIVHNNPCYHLIKSVEASITKLFSSILKFFVCIQVHIVQANNITQDLYLNGVVKRGPCTCRAKRYIGTFTGSF